MGICISRPPALCLAPDPGPQFVFTGPGPQFVFIGPGPKFVFTGPGPQFVFTGPGPNFYYPALVRPKPELADTNLAHPPPLNLYLLALAYDFYYGALNLHLPSYL